jgi:hypothetical protein
MEAAVDRLGSPAEKRRHPRYAVALPVSLRGLPLWTRNLSSSGLQVSCPAMNFGLLFGSGPREELEIELSAPNRRCLRLGCRVVYASQHGDEHLVGLEILRMSEADRTELEQLVETLAGRYARR